MLAVAAANAVPAYRTQKTVRQSDGTQLRIFSAGDENLSYMVTEDGLPLMRNALGDWCYAVYDGSRLQSRGIVAHEPEARDAGETDQIRQMQAVASLRQVRQLKTPAALGKRTPLPQRTDLTGQKRGLIILAQFQDVKFTTENAYDTFNAIANATDYKENGFYGSVRDYFRDMSRGKFGFVFDVVGPVTLPRKMEYYGKDSVATIDGRQYDMIDYHCADLGYHACQLVDDQVDFRNYDWDGDGEADMVFVIYAGYGQNYGAPSNTVWPFKGYMSHSDYDPREFLYLDGIFLDVFACTCELFGTTGTTLNGLGTMTHEFSHCFGLKDHYGTQGTGTHPMGYWDVMDYGSYNDQARRPVSYTAYERQYCGWLDPIELKRPSSVRDMKPITQGGETYVIYNDAFRDECFYIENRAREGWDEFLPNYGLLVTHLDYFEVSWRNNTVNTIQMHPRYGVVHADNKDGMTESDQAGDTFPYIEPIQGRFNDFLTDVSTPATVLFNDGPDGSKRLGKPITNMDVKRNGPARFDFMGGGDAPDVGISISTIDSDSPARYFNLQGLEIAHPAKGETVIEICNQQSRKIRF